LKSPFVDEAEIRPDAFGRAEAVTCERLRGDFASALQTALRPGESVVQLIAVRPDRVMKIGVPAQVLALTNRALIVLREPAPAADVHYGIRTLIVPLRAICAVELGEHLLRGTFHVAVGAGVQNIEIPYHVLDEGLFTALLQRIRDLANL
jgi:hypothetical protein